MLKSLFGKFSAYIIIGLMSFALLNSNKKVQESKHKAGLLENTINDLRQDIRRTELRLNDSIALYQAEVKALNMTQANLKSKYGKLLAASKLRPKDVGSVSEVKSVIRSVDTVVAEVDTFGGIKANLQDPFVSIDVNVLPDRNTIIDYEVRDSLTIINVQKKRSWLFGLIKWREPKSVRVINHNPKADVVSLQTIDIIE